MIALRGDRAEMSAAMAPILDALGMADGPIHRESIGLMAEIVAERGETARQRIVQ